MCVHVMGVCAHAYLCGAMSPNNALAGICKTFALKSTHLTVYYTERHVIDEYSWKQTINLMRNTYQKPMMAHVRDTGQSDAATFALLPP